MSRTFRSCSLDQPYLLPPSLHDWLPENHLARFVADLIPELDLSEIVNDYGRKDNRGLAAYHPSLMVRLLLYANAIGQPSSRKIEQATYTDLAFRYLAANQHPDHDTIAHFRRRHLTALAQLFLQVLRLCKEAGLVKLAVGAIQAVGAIRRSGPSTGCCRVSPTVVLSACYKHLILDKCHHPRISREGGPCHPRSAPSPRKKPAGQQTAPTPESLLTLSSLSSRRLAIPPH